VVNTKEKHGKAVKWVGQCLKGTKDLRLIDKPNMEKVIEVHVC
jgi:hypothetical protein